eukprot:scaffold1475_cov128-Skeletonema_dohrnii-CCMP3373.AAC.2
MIHNRSLWGQKPKGSITCPQYCATYVQYYVEFCVASWLRSAPSSCYGTYELPREVAFHLSPALRCNGMYRYRQRTHVCDSKTLSSSSLKIDRENKI